MKRRHYGIEWAYGRMVDEKGQRIGRYYRFGTRRERDHWVSQGNPYTTAPRFREAVPARDSELRCILRHLKDVGPDGRLIY